MTAPEVAALVERVAGEHDGVEHYNERYMLVIRCDCDERFEDFDAHRAHVASVTTEALLASGLVVLAADVEALAAGLLGATQDGQGHRSDHWRGNDFADGFDAGLEHAAERLVLLTAAAPRGESCFGCGGTGNIADVPGCPDCHGTGTPRGES